MLLNAAKCQSYSFYCFWVIKEKPTGRGGVKGLKLPPNQIRDKIIPVRTSNKKCKPAESFESLSETCKFYVC